MKTLILSDFLPDEKLVLSEDFKVKLNTADAIIFNLEGSPLLLQEERNIPLQIMPFEVKGLIEFVQSFGKDKFHIALANNHILDNRTEGFDFLISELNKYGIKYFGTCDKPYTVIDDVAILNFVTAETVAKRKIGESRLNYLFYDTSKINRQIHELEEQYDKLILYPHWGRDMDTTVFSTYDDRMRFNKKWKIFGHHPHVISGIEQDKIYSMGNNYIPHPYYFDVYSATHYGLVIELDSLTMLYSLYMSTLRKREQGYMAEISPFVDVPESIKAHGKNFNTLKKLFLKFFAFKGNATDLVKLNLLQLLTKFFSLKYKLSKK